MGFFSDFFTSPRERAAKGAYSDQLTAADNLPNSFGNINSLNDVYSQYGVNKFDIPQFQAAVKKAYNPAFRGLATEQAQAQNALRRQIGNSATPGIRSSALDTGYAQQYNNLLGNEANQELSGIDKANQQNMDIAKLFATLQQSKDSGAFAKFNAKNSALQNYLSSLSPTSGFNDLTSGIGALAKVAAIPTGTNTSILSTILGNH